MKTQTGLQDPWWKSLTQEDLRATIAIDRQLDIVAARQSLFEFVCQSWHVLEPATRFEPNWHHKLICDVLQGMFEDWQKAEDPTYNQRVRNAIFSLPPGSLKPVHIDGLVNEKTKGQIPIKDIVVGDEVQTHRGRYRKVLQVADQGVLPTLEFKTRRGCTVRTVGG